MVGSSSAPRAEPWLARWPGAALEVSSWAAVAITAWGGFKVDGRYLYPGLVWAVVFILVAALGRRVPLSELSLARVFAFTLARRPAVLLAGAAALWCAAIVSVQVLALLSLGVGPYELGIYEQSIWNIVHHGDAVTSLRGGRSLMGEHFQPMVYAIAQVYRLWQAPELLVGLQTVAVASGVWPLYRLARRHIGERSRLAVIVPLAYLAYAPLRGSATFNYHPEVMACPAILWLVWAREVRRWWLVALLGFAVMSMKEHDPLVVAAIGLLLLVRDRKILLGVSFAGIGVAWFYGAVSHWIPTAAGLSEMHHLGSRYGHLGASVGEVFGKLLTEPWILPKMAIMKLEYAVKLVGPLALIPFARPFWLLGALPTYAMNVLSSYPQQASTSFQYTAEITPFLFCALVESLPAATRRFSVRRIEIALLAAVLLFVEVPETFKIRQSVAAIGRGARVLDWLESIPASASVSATPAVVTHLAGRRSVYLFPEIHDATWVVIEREGLRYSWHSDEAAETATRNTLASIGFARVVGDDDLEIWIRRPGPGRGIAPPGDGE